MDFDMKDSILKYGVIAKKRFRKKEKIRFINNIEPEFKCMGYKTSILSPQGSKGKAIDLIIGDVKKADTIIMANYDTPSKNFGFYKYYPFDIRNRKLLYSLTAFIPLLFITVLCFIFSAHFLRIKWLEGFFSWKDFMTLSVYIIGIYLIVHYSKGIPNSHNLNRNTSGVIGCLAIASTLTPKQQKNVAFVLTDFGCINNMGDQMIKEFLGDSAHRKRFILLDCIGSGKNIAVNYSNTFKDELKKLDSSILRFEKNQTNYSSANIYDHCIIFAGGNQAGNKFVCENIGTRRDLDIDPDKIKFVVSNVLKLL